MQRRVNVLFVFTKNINENLLFCGHMEYVMNVIPK